MTITDRNSKAGSSIVIIQLDRLLGYIQDLRFKIEDEKTEDTGKIIHKFHRLKNGRCRLKTEE
jgi:hypothetical protein